MRFLIRALSTKKPNINAQANQYLVLVFMQFDTNKSCKSNSTKTQLQIQ